MPFLLILKGFFNIYILFSEVFLFFKVSITKIVYFYKKKEKHGFNYIRRNKN